MRSILFLFTWLILYGCQTASLPTPGTWEAEGLHNRYTARFYIQIDSQHQVHFTDRRHSLYDLAAAWQQKGRTVVFATDSLYQFTGSMGSDTTFSGWLVAGSDSFQVTFYPTEEQPFPGKPQEPRPPFPYHTTAVSFPSRDTSVLLAGTLTYPKGEGPFPTALLISGSGGQDRNSELMGHKPFLVQAHHYTQQGIAVLRFDDRGIGQSSGSLTTATSADLAKDVMGAVDFLLQQPQVDTQALFLIGHSEGGILAPMVANALPVVDGIILLAGPAVPGDTLLLEQSRLLRTAMGFNAASNAANEKLQSALFTLVRQGEMAAWNAQQIEEETRSYFTGLPDSLQEALGLTAILLDQLVEQASNPWLRYFLTYDPGPALQQLQVPVLALFGEKDLQVPPKQNKPVMERDLVKTPANQVTIKVYPGLNHLFQTAQTGTHLEYANLEETFHPLVLNDIANWILHQSK